MPTANGPEQCDILIGEAISAGDLEAAAALYEPGATFVAEPGKPVTGTEAIKEVLTGFLAMKPTLKVEVSQAIQSGDTALLYSKWTLTGTGPDGSAVNMEGNGTEVVRRQSGGNWLFVVDDPWGAA